MKFAHLNDRSLVEISGEEAESFLENLITCKTLGLKEGEASFGALLTPQGKILFDFFLIKTSNGFLIDIKDTLGADFIKRLIFYRLRAKVTIEAKPEIKVTAIWGEDIPASTLSIKDPRLEAMGTRDYSGAILKGEEADYTSHRISNGIPQGGYDFEYSDAYPHEVLMDQFGGVDFKKGCYVGQEVVSRMQHRGTTKKRVILVSSDKPLPASGTAITADGKPAGTLGSTAERKGLALLRLDRVAKAEQVLVENIELATELPFWVNFIMPEKD